MAKTMVCVKRKMAFLLSQDTSTVCRVVLDSKVRSRFQFETQRVQIEYCERTLHAQADNAEISNGQVVHWKCYLEQELVSGTLDSEDDWISWRRRRDRRLSRERPHDIVRQSRLKMMRVIELQCQDKNRPLRRQVWMKVPIQQHQDDRDLFAAHGWSVLTAHRSFHVTVAS